MNEEIKDDKLINHIRNIKLLQAIQYLAGTMEIQVKFYAIIDTAGKPDPCNKTIFNFKSQRFHFLLQVRGNALVTGNGNSSLGCI